MTEFEPAALERAALDDRTVRALTERMTVCDDVGQARGAPGIYVVTTESGSEYLVDAREGRCTCPDAQHRDVRCKHQRRINFATGERAIPACLDVTAVDPQLGEHVDGTPHVTATDGGTAVDGTEDSQTPDDDDDNACDCSDLPDSVPCFECYCSGAEFDN